MNSQPATAGPRPTMVDHLRAEMRKLLTTPMVAAHGAAAVAIGALGVIAALTQAGLDPLQPADRQQFMIVAAFGRIALVLLGIRFAVDEYRHGTAATTLCHAVHRHHVVVAKVVVGAVTGAVIGLAAQASTFAVAAAGFAADGHRLDFDGRLGLLLLGATLAGAAWVAIGVAVGELVREAIPATVGAVLWFVLGEEVVASRLGTLGGQLPGIASFKVFLSGDGDLIAAGMASMVAWATALALAAAVLVDRRDLAG